MGLLKWMARRGAVGRTARRAAGCYLHFRRQHPSRTVYSDNEIFRLMILDRYRTRRDFGAEACLLGVAGQLVGLRGLVVAVLTAESGFSKNSATTQRMLAEVIEEELERCGVPREVIFGSGRGVQSRR
jgi:hypothetical protein